MESQGEYLLKICMIGSHDELKNKFIRRFAEDKFSTKYYPTLGVDITTKQIQIDDQAVKLILVDTVGLEFHIKSRPSYYRGSSAAIICFEKSKKGLEEAKEGLTDFRKHIPHPDVPISFLCFDTGLDEITTEECQTLAKGLGVNYYELTELAIKEGSNIIEEIFMDLTIRVLATKEEE